MFILLFIKNLAIKKMDLIVIVYNLLCLLRTIKQIYYIFFTNN